jgi:hypothetical protein
MTRLLVVATTALVLSACGTAYYAEPLHALVADATTGVPLAGAVVVAHWELEGGLHGSHVGELKILETTTASDGRFQFPGWGPERHRGPGRLFCRDPEILVLKPGYMPKVVSNPWDGPVESRTDCLGADVPNRKSMWNGKTIPLVPAPVGAPSYAEAVYTFGEHVQRLHRFANAAIDECSWLKTPQMLKALHRMGLDFEARGVRLPAHGAGQRFFQLTAVPQIGPCANAATALNEPAP